MQNYMLHYSIGFYKVEFSAFLLLFFFSEGFSLFTFLNLFYHLDFVAFLKFLENT